MNRYRAKRVEPDLSEQKGVAFYQAGVFAGAIQQFHLALEAAGPTARIYHNLGMCFFKLARYSDARDSFNAALQNDPNHCEALFNLGKTLKALNDRNGALICYQRTIALDPTHARAWNNQGTILNDCGEKAKAIEAFQQAILLGDLPSAHFNLANAFSDLGRNAESEHHYRRSLELAPTIVEAHTNLGSLLLRQGKLSESLSCFQRAREMQPAYAPAMTNAANVTLLRGAIPDAIRGYREVLAADPFDHKTHSNLCLSLNYDAVLSVEEIFQEHMRFGSSLPLPNACPKPTGPITREGRINIGYVSADFREHAIANFFKAILAHHNRDKFKIHCYSDVTAPDPLTHSFRNLVEVWHDTTHLGHGELADNIRSDNIDLLFDLAGHTSHNRLPAFALKPARCQITYLGYPNTTGLTAMDYRITDAVSDPAGAERFYTEKLIRLPGCFLCFTPPENSPSVAKSPCKANGYITFGCFNALPKINTEVIGLWSAVLREMPGAKLLIKNVSLQDPLARQRLEKSFLLQGIESERLIFPLYAESRHDHLASYNLVDIALDTFPYNGTTTTCEALWMGVPVVTLKGDRHAARVGASLLGIIGSEDQIATNKEDYVKKSVTLAAKILTDSTSRAQLRQRMKKSRLCNGSRFMSVFEAAIATL